MRISKRLLQSFIYLHYMQIPELPRGAHDVTQTHNFDLNCIALCTFVLAIATNTVDLIIPSYAEEQSPCAVPYERNR